LRHDRYADGADGSDSGTTITPSRPERGTEPAAGTPLAPATEPAAGRPPGPLRWLLPVVVTVSIGMFVSTLDSAIVGIAYPALGKDLGATSESVQWVTTGYKLSQGVVIPAAVWLCRRFGLGRMYFAALLGYAVTSALCASATNIESLVAFRILQAIPGALTPIVCVGIIYKLIPKASQSIALGMFAIIAISAPGVAPFIGGYLVEYLNWRFVFLAGAPAALLGMGAAALLLPRMPPSGAPPPFDFPGFVCIALGCSAVLLALSKGPQWGWTSYPILALLGVGANALVAFVAVELRVANPLLDLRIFTFRPFVVALVVLEAMFTGLTCVFAFLPMFLQQAQTLTPSQAGMIFVPQAIVWIIGIPLSGILWQLIGARKVTILGLVLMGGATLMLGQLNVDLPHPRVVLLLCVRALGMGLVMLPMLGGAIYVLPTRLVPDGIVFRTMVQRTGAALGLAAISVLVTARRAQHFADRSALLDISAPYHEPRILQLQQQGPGGLVPLWQSVQVRSLTAAYSDAYLLVGVGTLAVIALIFLTNWPTPPRMSRGELVEVGV
jgi:EmrB/QacA subfamily drug resistance transporter